ncbi:MAG: serine hydrolase domain-containing protein [Ferruginibacter sp.]|nr:beta-lactamase family protein [Ferruginibacter sp.]
MIKLYKTNIFCFLLILLLMQGCSSSTANNEEKKDAEKTTKIPLYKVIPPKPISNKELLSLHNQCKTFYDTILNPSGFNGGIIVAKGGNIIFEKYKGFVNLDSVNPITASTPLHIASVSKTFTAMAILKLQEQGKLHIDDTLSKYFTNFNYPTVTIKDLLTHRSGLPNYLHFLKEIAWPDTAILRNSDILEQLILKKPNLTTITTPNTKFAYNNTNYALLALLIEKISGKTYPVFMKENVFEPLSMLNTFVRSNMDTNSLSKSFDWKGRLIHNTNLDEVYGDKNIYSTAQDLLKWDRALANHIFLTAITLETAYTPYSNEKPGIKNYGLGWRMNIYGESKKIIFHNGWWHGNNAAFIRLQNEDATIIVLSNRFARSVYTSKILVNIFGNYFDVEAEDTENIVPSTIPEIFPAEKRGKKSKIMDTDFSDRNKKEE